MFSSRRGLCAHEEKHWSGKRLAGHLGLSRGCLRSLLGQFKKNLSAWWTHPGISVPREELDLALYEQLRERAPLPLKGWSRAPWTDRQREWVLPTWHCHQTPAPVSFSLQTLLQRLAQLDKIKRSSPLHPSQAGRRPHDHVLRAVLHPITPYMPPLLADRLLKVKNHVPMASSPPLCSWSRGPAALTRLAQPCTAV